MKTIFSTLLLIFFFSNFSFGQTQTEEYKKKLIGKWEYNVSYDTIAVEDDGKNKSGNFFFTNMKISKDKVKISGVTENWGGKWELKNGNEFFIYLDNNKVLKYYITKLSKNNLELQSFGVSIPTLGYKRK